MRTTLAGCLSVSLRCHPLREALLTPHLKFFLFSVTICHHLHPLNVLTFQEALSDSHHGLDVTLGQNYSRITLSVIFVFLTAYVSL